MNQLKSQLTGKTLKLTNDGNIEGGLDTGKYISLGAKKLYVLTTAVTSGVTTDSTGAAVGDFAVTSNATGRNQLFYSDGTNWVAVGDGGTQAAFVAALTGAGSGTANGALEAEGTLSTAGGNTYTDAAVNTILGKIENNIAELAAKHEALRASLVASGQMASS